MAEGGTIGGLLGGATGLIASGGNPAIAKIGAQAGSAAGNLIQGFSNRRKAEKLTPDLEDAQRRNLLNEVNRKRKQLASGSAEYRLGADILSRNLAGTSANILRAGGGNIGATMSGLAKANVGYGDALNKLTAQNDQLELGYLGVANQIGKEVADRRMDLLLTQKAQKLAEANAQMTQGERQATNLLASVGLGGGSPFKKTDRQPVTSADATNPAGDQEIDISGARKTGMEDFISGNMFKGTGNDLISVK